MITYEDWNTIDYAQAWEAQTRLFQERVQAKQQGENHLPDVLVACEHLPVLTLGKSGHSQNLLVSEAQLQRQGVAFYRIDRGGDITFHGPGQLVCYPIFDLQHFGIGLKEYIYRLEEAVIRFLKPYGLAGERLESATGVWLEAHSPRARKICAIGVKSSRYVTMHGLALNLSTDLSYFRLINPCGFVDKGVTSLCQEIGRDIEMSMCKQQLRNEIESLFPIDGCLSNR